MNINAVPDSEGIDIQKFQYFFETSFLLDGLILMKRELITLM